MCKQIVNYVEKLEIWENTSGFPQNHSYITLLLKLKDDITKVKGRDCSFGRLLKSVWHYWSLYSKKKALLGFSKKYLLLIRNYLSDRWQYIQVNHITSLLSQISNFWSSATINFRSHLIQKICIKNTRLSQLLLHSYKIQIILFYGYWRINKLKNCTNIAF